MLESSRYRAGREKQMFIAVRVCRLVNFALLAVQSEALTIAARSNVFMKRQRADALASAIPSPDYASEWSP